MNLICKQTKTHPDVTPAVILVDGNGLLHIRRAGIACFVGVKTGIPTIGVAKNFYHLDGLTRDIIRTKLKHRVKKFMEQLAADEDENPYFLFVDKECINPLEKSIDTVDPAVEVGAPVSPLAVKLRGESGEIWGAALVGHGGCKGNKSGFQHLLGTKNPIYISIGHNICLLDAIRICAEISYYKIPEPIRQADRIGRDMLRASLRAETKIIIE